MRPTRVVALVVAAVVGCLVTALTLAGVGAAASGAVDDVSLAGSSRVNVLTRISASVPTVEALVTDPVFVCELMSGCQSIRSTGGRRYSALVVVDGVPGTQTVSVRIGVLVDRSLTFSYAARNSYGSVASRATVSLSAGGSDTTKLRYKTTYLSGKGLFGRMMASQAQSQIRAGIVGANATYLKVVASTYPTSSSIVGLPKKLKANKKFTVRLSQSVSSPLATPPSTSGKATVFINHKRACVMSVTASTGSCKAKAPSSGKTTIEVSFSGTQSNGSPLYAGASASRKVR